MKKIINLVTLRAGIATALCASLLVYPSLRVSAAGPGSTARAATDVKSESQFKSEASRYDGAIRAISGVATMKLDTADDLTKAVAIVEREQVNLKLRFSKFVVTGLSDSTFSSAVKKKLPDKQAADAFAKELKADRKAILKLDGAEALKARIERNAQADAAVLRRAGERLKEAAERIKKAAQGNAGSSGMPAEEFKVIRASFSIRDEVAVAPGPRGMSPAEPVSVSIIVAVAISASLLAGFALGYVQHDVTTVQDEETKCLEKADDSYSSCRSAANELPRGFPLFLRETARALCIAKWLLDTAACHLLS